MAAQDSGNDFAVMQREISELTDQLKMCNAQTSADGPAGAEPDISLPTAPAAPPVSVTEPAGRDLGDDTVPERWPAKPKQS